MYLYIHAVECVYMYVYVGKRQFQMQLLHYFSVRAVIKAIIIMYQLSVQGGEDPQDASSRRSFSANEPLIIGLFCVK